MRTKKAQIICPNCGGLGYLEIVSREMALDAEAPEMQGMEIECDRCKGKGWIYGEEESDEA